MKKTTSKRLEAFLEDNRLSSEKVFREPLHDHIHISYQLILDLINSKELQRLRRIKQLGTSQYTFHGAEHSRFSHSLGVYELTRKIINNFTRRYSDAWDDDYRLVTLCAALLHDIGHGPFSHTFEKVFKTDHEALTTEIILNEETEVNAILSQVSPDFPRQVASVITQDHPNPQVVQLISSQIDADRMDYLLRDAYFTGANYGSFDLSRIMRVMRPYEDRIAFDISGMHAVEDYILCRYQMYMQVYFHPVSRGMEVTLDRLLKRAFDLYQDDRLGEPLSFLKPFFDKTYTLKDYLKLDDGVMLTAISLWTEHEDPYLSQLAQMFLNRRPLKSIEYDPEKDEAILDHLRDLVGQASYDKNLFTGTNTSSDISYDYKLKQKAPILLVESDGTLIELGEVSKIANILSDNIHGDHRLYVPREFIKQTDNETMSVFADVYKEFARYVKNGKVIHPDEEDSSETNVGQNSEAGQSGNDTSNLSQSPDNHSEPGSKNESLEPNQNLDNHSEPDRN